MSDDLNKRINTIINAMVDAMDEASTAVDAEPVDLPLAAVSMAVRVCLAAATPGRGREMMAHLCNEYFSQAERNFEAVQ